jgi:hypothetical protein
LRFSVGYSLLLIDAQLSYYLARLVPSGISNLERATADCGERPGDDERDPNLSMSRVAAAGIQQQPLKINDNMLR